MQVIFFEVPDSTSDNLYIRIFDADTGGVITDTIDRRVASYNTTVAYTLRGGNDAYTGSGARSSHPNPAGINSGTLMTQIALGADSSYHDVWRTVFGPFSANQGEHVGSNYVFKLAVEGGAGDDGNRYNVALSTSPISNTAPGGGRIFAYSWTFQATDAERPPLYSYVPVGTLNFEQHNWDADYTGGAMTLHTPVRDILVPSGSISGDGNGASSSHGVQAGEDGATWAVTLEFSFAEVENDITFWAIGDGTDMAIFAHPTMNPPP